MILGHVDLVSLIISYEKYFLHILARKQLREKVGLSLKGAF
jgi:hypothetical protein